MRQIQNSLPRPAQYDLSPGTEMPCLYWYDISFLRQSVAMSLMGGEQMLTQIPV